MTARITRLVACGATAAAHAPHRSPSRRLRPAALAKCFGKPATIVKGNGDDNIKGTNGNDVIIAGDGENDVERQRRQRQDLRRRGRRRHLRRHGQRQDGERQRRIDFIGGRQGNDLHVGGGGDDQIDAVQDAIEHRRGPRDRQEGLRTSSTSTTARATTWPSAGGGNFDECPADAGDDVDCEI